MNQDVVLDFELTEEQMSALNLHFLFKQKRCYDVISENDSFMLNIDKVQVWFEVSYNDNTYDVVPIYFDLIQDDKVVRKVRMYHDEFEIPEFHGDQNEMQSFTITKRMLV